MIRLSITGRFLLSAVVSWEVRTLEVPMDNLFSAARVFGWKKAWLKTWLGFGRLRGL